jgi:hypothetical protein
MNEEITTNGSHSPTKNERYSRINQNDDDDLDVIDEVEMVQFQKAFSMPTNITIGNNFEVVKRQLDLKIKEISEDCESCDSDTSVSQSDNFHKKQEKYSTTRNISEKKSTKKIINKYFFVHKAMSSMKSKKYRSVSPAKGVNNKIKSSSRKLTLMKTNSIAFQRNNDKKKNGQNSANSFKQSVSSVDEREESPPREERGNGQERSIISPVRCFIDCLKGTLL